MNWEEKLETLQALFPDVHVAMRAPGFWCVAKTGEVGGDGFLSSDYGEGNTPAEAVENTWRVLVDQLPGGKWLTPDGGLSCWRWNGYRWVDVTKTANHSFKKEGS